MTTYQAYDAGLPCKNPSCASHGKPHPNCRCYDGNMAEGGEVQHFCATNKAHNNDCEYYAGGGSVGMPDMPQHADPASSVASFLGHGGLHGILGMDSNKPDQIHRYNHAVKRGHKKFDAKVNHLFGGGSVEDEDYTKAHKKIEDWLENGGITQEVQDEIHMHNAPQSFADGGKVKASEGLQHDNHIANVYPEQNIMLQAAKGRMSSYLNSLKPQKNMPKLAFDSEPDTRQQEKSYKRALKTAANPLHILDKVKNGTIEPEDVGHLKNLYPELSETLQKKVTEQITKAQMNGKKPSYKVRQGLSLLMGIPLSGEMTPQNMMAAQATFQNKKDQQQASGQPQKKLSAIGKSYESNLTPSEAAAARQQKQ